MEHFEELRMRILIALGFWGIGSVAAWIYGDWILKLLRQPLIPTQGKVQVITTGLTEQLFIKFSVALWGGFFIALPFVLHQIWLFIEPALTRPERRYAIPFVLGTLGSFVLGNLFCFKVILPSAIPFLLSLLGESSGVASFLNLSNYIGNVLTYLVTFGILFQLPILSFMLTKLGLIRPSLLIAWRRYALVVILIVSAVITPTSDPFNLALMALPIYLLYEISIWVSLWSVPRNTEQNQSI